MTEDSRGTTRRNKGAQLLRSDLSDQTSQQHGRTEKVGFFVFIAFEGGELILENGLTQTISRGFHEANKCAVTAHIAYLGQ